MISLTRLNSHPIVINCDLIRFVEASPDTTLTLVTGEKIVVLECCEEVVAKAVGWRAGLLRAAFPANLSQVSADAVSGDAAASSSAAAGAYKAEFASRKLERHFPE